MNITPEECGYSEEYSTIDQHNVECVYLLQPGTPTNCWFHAYNLTSAKFEMIDGTTLLVCEPVDDYCDDAWDYIEDFDDMYGIGFAS